MNEPQGGESRPRLRPTRLRTLQGLALLATLAIGIGAGVLLRPTVSTSPPQSSGSAAAPGLLFVVRAEDMSVEGSTLTMSKPTQAVIFTDRPNRMQFVISPQGLVDSWTSFGFTASPPNAAIDTFSNGQQSVATIELTKPQFDSAAQHLTFSFTTIGSQQLNLIRGQGIPAALFIDAGNLPQTVPLATFAPLASTLESTANVTSTPAFTTLIEEGLSALFTINDNDAARSDAALQAMNIRLFLDNYAQVAGTQLSSEQRRLMTVAIIKLFASLTP